MDYKNQIPPKGYYYECKINKIKMLGEFLVNNLDKRYTLEELSHKFDIPLTPMKNCFKIIYKKSIYHYLKNYRMHLHLRRSLGLPQVILEKHLFSSMSKNLNPCK